LLEETPLKSKSLTDLAKLKEELNRQKALEEKKQKIELEQEKEKKSQKNLFIKAIGEVKPIQQPDRVRLIAAPPDPIPFQQIKDDQAVLVESLSDEFDASTLLDVDDQLSFRRIGIGLDVTKKLRTGGWSIQGQIDLHGLRREEAREALAQFIRDACKVGWRCVRVVHGKGLGSPGKESVLKSKTQAWLVQKNEVLAFVQAKASEGGAGALVVLLKGAL
jgi:DNA-nicking Smr family endonuclease